MSWPAFGMETAGGGWRLLTSGVAAANVVMLAMSFLSAKRAAEIMPLTTAQVYTKM